MRPFTLFRGRSPWRLAILIGLIAIVPGHPAEAKMRYAAGVTFVTGFSDVVDIYENNLRAEGYDTDSFNIPVGITFQPYYEFPSGLRIGGGVGPLSFLSTTGDADSVYFFNIPLNGNIGFTFTPPGSNVAPYVRGGIMYHLATGDYVKGTSPGPFGAVGIEFMRNRKVSLGFELAIDTAQIEFEKKYANSAHSDTEKIKPYDVMISVFAAF